MIGLLIREFRKDDQDAARNLILEGLGEHFGFVDQTLNPDLCEIAKAYPGSGHDFYVAIVDDQIVGTVALIHESPTRLRVARMTVARANRRSGIAKALMDHLVARSEEMGATELLAFTEPAWGNALGFYRNYGFAQFGADDVDIHLKLEIGQNDSLTYR